MFFPYINSNYFIYMVPAFIITMLAQWYVNLTYKKWSKVQTRSRMKGADAAEYLKRSGNLYDVEVEAVAGNLTDHYDPRRKKLRLSQAVYQGSSIASFAITAHEMGHAKQDADGYFPLKFRTMMVPAVTISSNLGWILIMAGLFLRIVNLAWLGVFAFSAGLLFALLTLPVEFNASSRAKTMLTNAGLITSEDERRGINAVLNAAALTYVAAVFSAAMQLLYWVSIIGGFGRRRS